MAPLRILCVHGVGDHHTSRQWQLDWEAAITAGISGWNPKAELTFEFLIYDEIFKAYPLNPKTYAEALYSLGGNGAAVAVGSIVNRMEAVATGAEQSIGVFVSGIEHTFHPSRGLSELPAQIRWTAGMVAQWSDNPDLRAKTRAALTGRIAQFAPDVIVAHSLGTLVSYDTFCRDAALLKDRMFIVLGCQVANAFVRGTFGGRISSLESAENWFQLFNPNDRVFSAPLKITANNFHLIKTDFTDGFLSHDAVRYLSHPNAIATVWQSLAIRREFAPATRATKAFKAIRRSPKRRALLVGINNYPDPQNALDGCVNDVFLISAALQESGFEPEDIRVVFNERATASAMMDRLHWLLDGVCEGDQRVFFYSGHGAQLPMYGPEGNVDRIVDCLVPYDFDWTTDRAITDDGFMDLYSQLPFGAELLCILDCCHAGGIARAGGAKIRGIAPPDDVRHRALKWNLQTKMWVEREFQGSNIAPRTGGKANRIVGVQDRSAAATHPLGGGATLRRLSRPAQRIERQAAGHDGPYMPVILEACRADQLSYEYRHGVTSYGAFTFALTSILSDARGRGRRLTFEELKTLTGARLKYLGYDQSPRLRGPQAVISQKIPWGVDSRLPEHSGGSRDQKPLPNRDPSLRSERRGEHFVKL